MSDNDSDVQSRDSWGSKFGFVMAAAGAAIGLGNIWKFPYTAGEGGGGAFVLIYICFAIFLGFSVMLTEFIIGRRAGKAAVGAFKSLDRRWTFVGALGILSALFIMGFYPVVGGWALAYIFKVAPMLSTPEIIEPSFGSFISSPIEPLMWMGLYLLLNIVIVIKGISGGIETAGKFLMPLLFAILIIVAIKGLTLEGSMDGLKFLFTPDFSKVDSDVILSALGQAFFSLSLGMSAMLTYGSYLDKKENLIQTTGLIVGMDTAVALLAGIAMFPAMFAFGIEPSAGPGLIFKVIPELFAQMGGVVGLILAVSFFVALMVAALTSSVSLLEVIVSYFIDEKGMKRSRAVFLSSAIMVVMSSFASLSIAGIGPTLFGTGLFDIFDLLTDKVFLSIGGMLICIFAGWFMKREDLKDEVTSGGLVSFPLFSFWYVLIKYVIPVVIAVVAIMGIKGGFDDGKAGIMILGLAIIAICALFSKKI